MNNTTVVMGRAARRSPNEQKVAAMGQEDSAEDYRPTKRSGGGMGGRSVAFKITKQ